MRLHNISLTICAGFILLFLTIGNYPVLAAQTLTVGKAQEVRGFKISSIYVQAVMAEHHSHRMEGHKMEGMKMEEHKMEGMEMGSNKKGAMEMKSRAESDIHLETMVEALDGNPLSLKPGQMVPYLDVRYRIKNTDTGEQHEGNLMPMFASNGLHYGNNVKMMGLGNYQLTLIIGPPTIMVHTDKETKIDAKWEPFEVDWSFKYFGTGKKGGY